MLFFIVQKLTLLKKKKKKLTLLVRKTKTLALAWEETVFSYIKLFSGFTAIN
ncbi:unnamed protein product [Arabidopsis halleri]